MATANTEDVSWSSDVDGVWCRPHRQRGALRVGPLQYSDGDHTLTATASRPAEASVERSVCQDRGYSEESLDLSVWEISGNAFWDEANEWLTLTTGGQFQSGTAFQTQQTVEADNIDITFLMYAGNRDGGADGMSLTVIDVDRMSTFVGGTGNGLGYAGLPGWTVEFDTYCNVIDETCDDHVSFHLDGDHTIPQFTTVVPNLENDQWQPVRVVMDGSHLTVTLDGVEILSGVHQLHRIRRLHRRDRLLHKRPPGRCPDGHPVRVRERGLAPLHRAATTTSEPVSRLLRSASGALDAAPQATQEHQTEPEAP